MIPNSLRTEILSDLESDVTGLWFLVSMARDYREANDPKAFREFVLGIISSLISEGAMNAGFPTEGGLGFRAWKGNPQEIVQRIEREWIQLDREPSLGDVVWFCRPENVTEFEK